MRLLLDTHTFVWWDNDELPRAVRDRIRSAEAVYVSAVSAWEIAIKSALGKMTARAALGAALEDYGFDALPITVTHADAVRTLPPHHRDPFDRLLVAQARIENLTIVSRDPAFRAYQVAQVWGSAVADPRSNPILPDAKSRRRGAPWRVLDTAGR